MRCVEIALAHEKMRRLKEIYRMYQINIDTLKTEYYDPYDYYYIDKEDWERQRIEEIKSIGQILKNYETEIRELRKQIKDLDRKQNENFILKKL